LALLYPEDRLKGKDDKTIGIRSASEKGIGGIREGEEDEK